MVLLLVEKRSLPNFELWLVDRVSWGAGRAAANTLIHFVGREGWGGAAANTL